MLNLACLQGYIDLDIKLRLTNRVDTESGGISEGWAGPRGVRLFANATHKKRASLALSERELLIGKPAERTNKSKCGYMRAISFRTSSSTLTSYSVTRSTAFFFSPTLLGPDARWIA